MNIVFLKKKKIVKFLRNFLFILFFIYNNMIIFYLKILIYIQIKHYLSLILSYLLDF